MVGLQPILDRLEGVRRCGEGYMARCPNHDDHTPSLSIREGRDGRILLHCFGGCDTNYEFELALDVILDGLERLRNSDSPIA